MLNDGDGKTDSFPYQRSVLPLLV